MIQLTKGLIMIADDNGYIVGRPRQKADQSIAIDKPKYYSTVGQAAQGALDLAMRMSVKDGSVTTLQELIEQQKRLHAELQRLIAPLDGVKARQRAVDAHKATEEGKDILQLMGGEKGV